MARENWPLELVREGLFLGTLLSFDRQGQKGRAPLTAAPHLREATFDDYGQIAKLQERNGLTSRSREDWLGLWIGNPAYEKLAGKWPIGWVLETRHGELVGTIGNIPMAYTFRGRPYFASTSCGWAVDPEYRSFSLQPFDRVARQPGVDLLIGSTVGVNSESCYRLYGFEKVPVGSWDKSSYWITANRGFARSALHAMAIPGAGALSYPASAVLYVHELLNGLLKPPRRRDIEVVFQDDFDDRMDGFWTRLERLKRHKNLALRDRRTLSWHFARALKRKALWIVAAQLRGEQIAYAIFLRNDNPALGLSRVSLVDFQAVTAPEASLRAILCHVINRCADEQVHLLEVVGCWQELPEYGRILAPYHRPLTAWTQYYRAVDPALRKSLKDPAVWLPSQFEGDVTI